MTGPLPSPYFEGAAAIRYFSLGRHALSAGLKLLSIGKGDAVLLPGYICRDLLAALHAVQAEPVFYPVDRTLAPQSLPVVPNVKAVLAVNYFGFPQVLDAFRAYCAAHDSVLIEDNAHGFLSRDARGSLLGGRGDLGIASMRKAIALPDGAALLVYRKNLVANLPDPLRCLDDPLPVRFVARHALGQIQIATGVPLRNLAENATRKVRKLRTGHAFPQSPPEVEFEIPGDAAIHCESMRMLGRTDSQGEVERRRALYRRFDGELNGLDVDPVFPELPLGVAPYGYPFRATDPVAAAVSDIARKIGLDCSKWPELPTAVARIAPDFYRNVFLVNFLC